MFLKDFIERYKQFGFSIMDEAYGYNITKYCGCLLSNIEYIKTALQKSDNIEFWNVWLMDYYEYEDKPFVHKKTISISELTIERIKEIDGAVIWNAPDKMYPERPSFYCLTITK